MAEGQELNRHSSSSSRRSHRRSGSDINHSKGRSAPRRTRSGDGRRRSNHDRDDVYTSGDGDGDGDGDGVGGSSSHHRHSHGSHSRRRHRGSEHDSSTNNNNNTSNTSNNNGIGKTMSNQSNSSSDGIPDNWFEFGASGDEDEKSDDASFHEASGDDDDDNENHEDVFTRARRRRGGGVRIGEGGPGGGGGVERASSRSNLRRSSSSRNSSSRDNLRGSLGRTRSGSGRGSLQRSASFSRRNLVGGHNTVMQRRRSNDDDSALDVSNRSSGMDNSSRRSRRSHDDDGSNSLATSSLHSNDNDTDNDNITTASGRESRREAMKRMYRDESIRLAANPRENPDFRRNRLNASSSSSSKPMASSRALSTSYNGLDGAPFGGGSTTNFSLPPRSKSSDDIALFDSVDEGLELEEEKEQDPEWIQSRAGRQDEIISLAQRQRDSAYEKQHLGESGDMGRGEFGSGNWNDGEGGFDDDADQPKALGHKKSAFGQIAKAFTKTAAVSRSAAKGSVNAVRDPKRAANRLGNVSKSVAKGTVNIVKDPKRAAIAMGNATKTVTIGSAKVGAGITKGIATGTIGATKTVVKGSLNTTKTVAVGTVNRTGKIVKGTARRIKGKDSTRQLSIEDNYDAHKLKDRNQISLVDRINQMVMEGDSEADIEAEQAKKIAAAVSAGSAPRQNLKSSILMPTDIASGSHGNWDLP